MDGLGVDQFQLTQRPLLEACIAQVRPDLSGIGQGFRQLRVAEAGETGRARVRLLFRDGKEIPLTLDCRARPVRDPFTNTNPPDPGR